MTHNTTHQTLQQKPLFFMQIAVYIGAFLSHFSSNIINVALPKLTHIFHPQAELVQWITIGYILTISVLLPFMGNLADRIGYRFLHNVGFIIFTMGSVLVACAPNLMILLICRVLQAIGTAMFQSVNMAIITLYTPKKQRGRALGMISTAVALGGMTGPVFGGLIIEWLSWHWLFVIHVPIAMIAVFLSLKYIPKSNPVKKNKPFDGMGILLFAIMISSLIFGIANGNSWGWISWQLILLFVVAIVTFCILLWWERKQPLPFLPYHLFQKPLISSCLLLIFVAFLITNATVVTMPFYLSKLGLPAYQIGYLMVVYPIILSVMGPVAGNLSDRYGSKLFAVIGLLCLLLNSLIIFTMQGHLTISQTLFSLILSGIGIGCIASPTNRLIMELIPTQFIGIIGGLLALLRNLGTLMGATLSLAFLSRPLSISLSLTYIFTICMIVLLICLFSLSLSYWLTSRSIAKKT